MFFPDFERFEFNREPEWNIPMPQPVWQLCPKCSGAGIVYTNWEGHGLFSTTCICDLCNGKKVISIFTGEPPQ